MNSKPTKGKEQPAKGEKMRKTATNQTTAAAGASKAPEQPQSTPAPSAQPVLPVTDQNATPLSPSFFKPSMEKPKIATFRAEAYNTMLHAKSQMEQSGNIKSSIKEHVLKDIQLMYDIVLNLCEESLNMNIQLETARSHVILEMYEQEKNYASRIAEVAKATIKELEAGSPSTTEILDEIRTWRTTVVSDVLEGQKQLNLKSGPSPSELMGEVKGLRQLIVMEGRKESHSECPAQAYIEQLKEVTATIVGTQTALPIAPADSTQLQDEIRQLSAALTNTQAQLEEIIASKNSPPKQPSYAEMARKPAPYSPRHSLIVSSSDPKDTSENVLDKIKGAVDARSTGIRVDNIRKARDQKVIIGCGSQEDAKKIMSRLEIESKELKVVEAQPKDPLVIIRDVLSYNSDEEIVRSIRSQNPTIVSDISDTDFRASVKYRRRARNPMESHIIMQVSPKLWQRLTIAGEVHIDLQRRPVYDQSPLLQCTKCLGFGHGRKFCKEEVDLCSHCGGPHLRNDCPIWVVGDVPSCRNCKQAKLERHDHGAFDTCCPIRRRWDSLARSSVAYG